MKNYMMLSSTEYHDEGDLLLAEETHVIKNMKDGTERTVGKGDSKTFLHQAYGSTDRQTGIRNNRMTVLYDRGSYTSFRETEDSDLKDIIDLYRDHDTYVCSKFLYDNNRKQTLHITAFSLNQP